MQSVITRLITLTLILGVVDGCRHAPELRPRLLLQGEPIGKEFWLAAPYVLTVKILRADLQGPRQPVFQHGPETLQLVKFSAHVENVIKGDMRDSMITFFYFAKVDQNPTYFLDPGKRYIISLRTEGGVLRSWADASQLKIEVHSGSHNQKELPIERGPEAEIAYILLTPGADCDLSEFARTLGWPAYGDPTYIDERLRQLQLSSVPALRDSACLATASMFWIRPKCVEGLLNSTDAQTRQAAERFLMKDDANLLGVLRSNPFSLFPQEWTDYMSEMLEIYTEDIRPEVREAACAALRSFAPKRGRMQCR